MTKYLGEWLSRPLITISRKELHDRHQRIAGDIKAGKFATPIKHPELYGRTPGARRPQFNRCGEATANATFRTLRAVWLRAREQHPELPAFATKSISWFDVEPRRNPIPRALLPLWYRGIMAMSNEVHRDLLRLILVTGLRRESASELQWTDIDFDAMTMEIRVVKYGKKRAFALPITSFVREILEARQKGNNELLRANAIPEHSAPYVFPACSKSGRIVEARYDVPGVGYDVGGQTRSYTVHDLRSVFLTEGQMVPMSAYVQKALVNHAQPKDDVTGRHYVRVDPDMMREALELVNARLLAIVRSDNEPLPSAPNVIALPVTASRQSSAPLGPEAGYKLNALAI